MARGVADGSVTLAFRRWRRQDVQPGQVFTSAAGMVRVDAVTVVATEDITDDEARLAGWPDAERLRRRLATEGDTYRVELSYAGNPNAVSDGALPANSEWMAEARRLKESGNKIEAIKLYREHTGLGLKEAKDAVEGMI